MSKEVKSILKEAEGLIGRLENGKTYPADYVARRFEKAALDNSKDILICSMKDVIVKVAKKREYLHQKEIGNLYDKMYGFSGGRSSFRGILGDLLPESRQFSKVAYKSSNLRTMEENPLEPITKDSELSNAFSVLFSLGNNSSFGTYKPGRNKSVEKAVISKLSRLGYPPCDVNIVKDNEHFVLCSTTHQIAGLKKVSTLIPVQVTEGATKEPRHIILGEEAVELSSRNLFLAIKEQERALKLGQQRRFASERTDGSAPISVDKAVLPKSLEEFANLENELLAAASKHDSNQVNLAINMLGVELSSFGAANPRIKIASSDDKSILFDVHVPTRIGQSVIHVPVEIVNGSPLLPHRFAADVTSDEQKIFDFSKEGFQNFIDGLVPRSHSLTVSRQTGLLSGMSYHQLMDRMLDGVANKDYKMAEDVLQTINSRFGADQFVVAFDKFSEMIKHSSDGSKRSKLIKEAYERGELIKISTSVQLYCPRLGLPVSKISFDEKGRIIPKGRRVRSDNQIEGASINTSKIILT